MVATTTEITVYDRVTDPASLIESLGKSMYEARMFGCSNEAQGRVLALACIAERKNPLELVRTYHIIDGKLSMRADAMLAEFRKLGGKVRWTATGDDGKEAKAVFTFEGVDTEIGYSIEDAKRAGLVRDKSNWVKDPGAMLRARVTSKGVRMLAPEIVAGYYTPEEIDDVNGDREPKAVVVADAETIAKAAQSRTKKNGKVDAKPEAETSGDVVDAEFVDAKPAAATTTAPATQPTQPAVAKTTKPGELEKPCSNVDREKIQTLFDSLNMTPDQRTKALAKRGAQVIRNLSAGQARELIAALEGLLAKKNEQAAAAKAAETIAPFEPQPSPTGNELNPCSADQVTAIKQLLAEINDTELVKAISGRLAEHGMEKVAELSWGDAVILHRCLDCRNMEEFFGRSLAKPVYASQTKPVMDNIPF